MKLKHIKPNMTELSIGSVGMRILFSYSTPVAAMSPAFDGGIRAEEFFSKTTSKHINEWGGRNFKKVPQIQIERLVDI